jgi:tRNA threonylcarbamoyl adenosine modification protein YeaZ
LGYRSKCLLAVDTSAADCAAAIFLNGKIFSTVREMKKGQAEHLFDVIEDTLEQARVKKSQIDLIVVGIGPGNFTGIRIGLAAAKGLALSLKVPLSGVNSFQATLYGQNEYEVAAIQAPQNSYYLGTYKWRF